VLFAEAAHSLVLERYCFGRQTQSGESPNPAWDITVAESDNPSWYQGIRLRINSLRIRLSRVR